MSASATIWTACIHNDIPYPHIQANILSISAEGQTQGALIDSINLSATIYLDEEVDIYAVNINECQITRDAHFVGDSLPATVDLSSPKIFTLRMYQDYQWIVRANQTIERYFTIANQIGASVIDVPGRRIVVTLPETANLSDVKVLSAKLGSKAATTEPPLEEGSIVNLTRPLTVYVTDYGRTEEWTIYATLTESTVTTVRVDAWTNVAWVYGSGEEGRDNTVEYRKASESEWTRVPDNWLTINGGSFHARLIHLDPQTEYVARAVSGADLGAEIPFVTGEEIQVPNSNFEYWWLDGKVWDPWEEGGIPYWDSGNKGAATLGQSNTTPTDDTPSGTGRAAKLETRFVGIGILGKLAAGNIFVGRYVRTDGTNGVLSFGRDFTQRPTKLKGYMKYHSAPISSTTAGFENYKNRPDTCIIWTALIDSPEPFEIRTNPSNRHLFDPDGSYVVGYGKVEFGHDIDDYQLFTIDIDYKSTERVPKYILIVASASKYGDYFTGGNGSVLYIDDFELLYDY